MVGTVTDGASGQPIPGAVVRLYRYEARSGATGCFSLGGPDALPFEFGISADGYKPLVVEAVPGSYQVTATLAPEHDIGESASQARPIDRDRFARLSLHCPGARR